MFSELNPETFLRVGNPLHGGHGDLELSIAKSTDSDGGNCAEPFKDPKISFRHDGQTSYLQKWGVFDKLRSA